MIRYSLHCADGHHFEGWFADAEAYETLHRKGRLACPLCGGDRIEKALMAPAVRPGRKAEAATVPAAPAPVRPEAAAPDLRGPTGEIETRLAELRRHVEANSDYVGMNFAAEARRIHAGEAPERSIYGEARPDEARQLIEDGVPVAPLPFRPTRKQN